MGHPCSGTFFGMSGSPFSIENDAVKWILNLPNLTGHLLGWRLWSTELDFYEVRGGRTKPIWERTIATSRRENGQDAAR